MNLRRLNPFADLPRGREVLAWGMYDLANQSFQLIINTLLFGLFLAKVVLHDPAQGKPFFGMIVAISLVIIVVLSPGLGAYADARGIRKRLLIGTGVGATVLTGSLCLLGPGMAVPAAILYIVAAVLVGLGENFLGAFLPFLSTPRTVGRISALGWMMSYIGAILLLGITAVAVFVLHLGEPADWRWLFGLAAVWFGAGILPAVFILPEPPADPTQAAPASGSRRGGPGAFFVDSFRRLRSTVREARRYRQLVRFLGVFLVFSLGTNTVVYFLGQIGDDLGFGMGQLVLFALLVAVTAGFAALFAARYQDRLGHRTTIAVFLTVWVASTLAMALSANRAWDPVWFWPIAGGIGFALGGIGTSSRAAVGAFTPPARAGEFFGLWGMVYKLSGVIGLLLFAWANARFGKVPSLFVLSGFFGAGLALLPLVDEREGVRSAAANGGGDSAGPR